MIEFIKEKFQKFSTWLKHRLQPAKNLLGIDIGASGVKLLELGRHGDNWQVIAYALVSLPPGAVVEKDIKNPKQVTQAIREAIIQSGTQCKTCAIAVPDASVISKVIQLDASLNDSDIENQILLEADRHIPYPIEEVSLDFQVLGKNANNNDLVDVLLVASHKNNVDARVAVVKASGLEVKLVDVESYAMERVSILLMQEFAQESRGQTIAIVDIGATMLTLTVLHETNTIFSRSEVFGCQLESFKETVVLQIRRALQFFFSTNQHGEIQHLFLTGGASLLPDMVNLVGEGLGISTKLANPFQHMAIVAVDGVALASETPRLTLSCGLALHGGNA